MWQPRRFLLRSLPDEGTEAHRRRPDGEMETHRSGGCDLSFILGALFGPGFISSLVLVHAAPGFWCTWCKAMAPVLFVALLSVHAPPRAAIPVLFLVHLVHDRGSNGGRATVARASWIRFLPFPFPYQARPCNGKAGESQRREPVGSVSILSLFPLTSLPPQGLRSQGCDPSPSLQQEGG